MAKTKTAMNFRLKRLLTLAEYLETSVSRKQFSMDIDYWWEENECGVVGCMGGHACSIPAFRNSGLRLRKNIRGVDWMIKFGNKFSFEALADFFGISITESIWLFDPLEYEENSRRLPKTPKQAAKVLRDFVRDKLNGLTIPSISNLNTRFNLANFQAYSMI